MLAGLLHFPQFACRIGARSPAACNLAAGRGLSQVFSVIRDIARIRSNITPRASRQAALRALSSEDLVGALEEGSARLLPATHAGIRRAEMSGRRIVGDRRRRSRKERRMRRRTWGEVAFFCSQASPKGMTVTNNNMTYKIFFAWNANFVTPFCVLPSFREEHPSCNG